MNMRKLTGEAAILAAAIATLSSFAATNITFTAGATVKVAFGARSVSIGEKVIGWTAESRPANLESIRFKC